MKPLCVEQSYASTELGQLAFAVTVTVAATPMASTASTSTLSPLCTGDIEIFSVDFALTTSVSIMEPSTLIVMFASEVDEELSIVAGIANDPSLPREHAPGVMFGLNTSAPGKSSSQLSELSVPPLGESTSCSPLVVVTVADHTSSLLISIVSSRTPLSEALPDTVKAALFRSGSEPLLGVLR